MNCPGCGSHRTRRGGNTLWAIYLSLIAAGLFAVLVLHLHAGLVAAIMVVIIVLAHLLVPSRVCLDCGKQWKP